MFLARFTGIQRITLAGVLCGVAVVGSMLSFPVLGSKCAPIQHMINIICAILLGPFYGTVVALISSLLRNFLGLGSLLAFPGSMFGALLCGIIFHKTNSIKFTIMAEVLGTAILGGLSAYPIAIFFMGQNAGNLAFYFYVIPFFISTVAGAMLAGVLIYSLFRMRVLEKI